MLTPSVPLVLPDDCFITAAGRVPGALQLAWCQFDKQHWRAELHQRWQLPLPRSLENAVVKRKAEFLASRWLVRDVMAQYGVMDFVLSNAADRSPCWPAAVQASLSHSHNMAVMAITREPLCIGVDVEQVMSEKTAQETAEMLMNAQERALLQQLPLPFSLAATLLFSLKESLYKALWPQLKQPMDFLQAQLCDVDPAAGSAQLRLSEDFGAGFNPHTRLQARFCCEGSRVITLLTHPYSGQ